MGSVLRVGEDSVHLAARAVEDLANLRELCRITLTRHLHYRRAELERGVAQLDPRCPLVVLIALEVGCALAQQVATCGRDRIDPLAFGDS